MSSSCTVPALAVHRLSFLLEKMADHALQQRMDLTFSQCMILSSLERNPACSQQSIAKCRDLTQAAVSRQVEILREKKLITREENAQNRREHVLRLTEKGVKLLTKGMEVISEKFDGVFSVLAKKDLELLHTSIKKVLDAVYKGRDCDCA